MNVMRCIASNTMDAEGRYNALQQTSRQQTYIPKESEVEDYKASLQSGAFFVATLSTRLHLL